MMLSTFNNKKKNFKLTCIGEEKSSSQSKPRRPANRDQHSCSKILCKHEACLPLLASIRTATTKPAVGELSIRDRGMCIAPPGLDLPEHLIVLEGNARCYQY